MMTPLKSKKIALIIYLRSPMSNVQCPMSVLGALRSHFAFTPKNRYSINLSSVVNQTLDFGHWTLDQVFRSVPQTTGAGVHSRSHPAFVTLPRATTHF